MFDRDVVKRASRLEEIIPEITGQTLHHSNGHAEPRVCCPFHKDKNPSLSVEIEVNVS